MQCYPLFSKFQSESTYTKTYISVSTKHYSYRKHPTTAIWCHQIGVVIDVFVSWIRSHLNMCSDYIQTWSWFCNMSLFGYIASCLRYQSIHPFHSLESISHHIFWYSRWSWYYPSSVLKKNLYVRLYYTNRKTVWW